MKPLIPLGIYRHYKGDEYEVVDFAVHSETNEHMVIYKSLNSDEKTWVRPLSMWGNPINVDGKTVMRFEYLAESSEMVGFIDTKQLKNNVDKINVGLVKYMFIMSNLHTCDVSQDIAFQKLYKGFYKVRRDDAFCHVYFDYMQKNKKNKDLTFGEVLTHIHKETNRVEPSFSSKLLATVNPNVPVWDSHVLSQLSIEPPNYLDKNRLQETIDTYSALENWYDKYMNTKNAADAITCFDKLIPNTNLTDIKKIDLVIWSMGPKKDEE